MKQFILNLTAKTCSFGLAALVAFFLTPFLVKHLGKDVYGFYPLVNNFIGYIGIVALVMNSMASRFIILAFMKKDFNKANSYFSSVFFVDLIIAAILVLPLSAFIYFLEYFLQIPPGQTLDIKLLFGLVFLTMLINLTSKIFSASVFAVKRVDLYSFVEIIQEICRVIFYVLLFWLLKPRIFLIGAASVMLALIYSVMHIYFTKTLAPNLKISLRFFDFSAVKDVFIAGFWGIFNQLGSMLLFSISLLLANIILGADALGSLAIVQTIPLFLNSFITAVIVVFYPEMMDCYAKKDIPALVTKVHFAQKTIGMATCIGIAIFIVLGKAFFHLWLPEEDASQLQTLSILTILRLTIVACVWPLTYLNIVMNTLKIPALTLITTGIINCAITVIILKTTHWGIYAIPVCLAIFSSIWFFFFLPLYSSKTLGVPKITFFTPMFRILPLFCAMLILGYGISYMFLIDSWMKLIVLCGGLLVIFFSLSMVWTFGIKNSLGLFRQIHLYVTMYWKKLLKSY